MGDRTSCILAARVPFVVRPRLALHAGAGEGYEIIRETYLHGKVDEVEQATQDDPDFP